jgi:molybdenum cofactor cytidylyltransferase
MARERVGILLAAGNSSRFGSSKLMHRMPNGLSMAIVSAMNLQPACDRVLAVLRPEQVALAGLLVAAGCQIVLSPDAHQGMGHSLAAAVGASADAASWLVALADMPFIDSSSHLAVASCLAKGARMVATQYQNQRGHPVGFSEACFHELLALTGDQGGRTLLLKNPRDIELVEVDDPGVILDIDHPHDLRDVALHAR